MAVKWKGKKGDPAMNTLVNHDTEEVTGSFKTLEPIASILDMGNRELIKLLIESTQNLMDEKLKMLDVQTAYQTTKEALQFHEDIMMHDIAKQTDPDGKKKYPNAEARAAERAHRQKDDKDFHDLISKRNESWHTMKEVEVSIEKIQNDILNIRTILKL